MKKCSSFQAGFTLVELMVVVGLISIIAYYSLSSNVGSLFRRNEVSSTAQTLHAALNYARNASINRGGDVIFCTPDPTDDTKCNATPEWGKGWMVLSTDNSGNNEIRVFPSKFGAKSSNSLVKFGNTQLAFRNGSANQNTTFVLCSSEGMGATAREVIVTMTGRIRTVAGDDPTAPQGSCTP